MELRMAIKQHLKKSKKMKSEQYAKMVKGLAKRRLSKQKVKGEYMKYADLNPADVQEGRVR